MTRLGRTRCQLPYNLTKTNKHTHTQKALDKILFYRPR